MSVVSVQKHTLTFAATDTFKTAPLTGSPDTAKCVPFIQVRATALGTAAGDDFSQFRCASYFPDSSTVRVDRAVAVAGESTLVVEVTVVEFGGSVAVQSGTYTLAGSGALTATANPTTLGANTFLYHNYTSDATGGNWYPRHTVRGEITDYGPVPAATLTFERDENGSGISGRWYTVDDNGAGLFEVQSQDITLTASTSQSAAITAKPNNKTWLIGSHFMPARATAGQDDNQEFTVNARLIVNGANVDQITVSRIGTTDNIKWTGYAITMLDATTVQRGTLTQAANVASATVGISSVTAADAFVHTAGSNGQFGGSYPSTSDSDTPQAMGAWTLNGSPSSTQIQLDHLACTSSASSDTPWEVIEFDLGAGPPSTGRVLWR